MPDDFNQFDPQTAEAFRRLINYGPLFGQRPEQPPTAQMPRKPLQMPSSGSPSTGTASQATVPNPANAAAQPQHVVTDDEQASGLGFDRPGIDVLRRRAGIPASGSILPAGLGFATGASAWGIQPETEPGKATLSPSTNTLLALQRYLVDPFERMAKAGGEFGATQLPGALSRLSYKVSGEPLGPVASGVAAGIGRVAGGAAADPRNWPFLAAGAVRPLLEKALTAGFTAQMGKGYYDALVHLSANWDKMSAEQRAEYATQAGISGLLTAVTASHLGPQTAREAVLRTEGERQALRAEPATANVFAGLPPNITKALDSAREWFRKAQQASATPEQVEKRTRFAEKMRSQAKEELQKHLAVVSPDDARTIVDSLRGEKELYDKQAVFLERMLQNPEQTLANVKAMRREMREGFDPETGQASPYGKIEEVSAEGLGYDPRTGKLVMEPEYGDEEGGEQPAKGVLKPSPSNLPHGVREAVHEALGDTMVERQNVSPRGSFVSKKPGWMSAEDWQLRQSQLRTEYDNLKSDIREIVKDTQAMPPEDMISRMRELERDLEQPEQKVVGGPGRYLGAGAAKDIHEGVPVLTSDLAGRLLGWKSKLSDTLTLKQAMPLLERRLDDLKQFSKQAEFFATQYEKKAKPLTPGPGILSAYAGGVPGFTDWWSKTAKVLGEKIRGRMFMAQDIRNLIATGQLPKAEVRAMGLDDWLAAHPGKVQTEELKKFLDENAVRPIVRDSAAIDKEAGLAETRARAEEARGAANRLYENVRTSLETTLGVTHARAEHIIDGFAHFGGGGGEEEQAEFMSLLHANNNTGVGPEVEERLRQAIDSYYNADERAGNAEDQVGGYRGAPAYERYTLPGPREKYREVLLQLPEQHGGDMRSEELAQNYGVPSRHSYLEPHFGEPNVFAHLRTSERLNSDGVRSLHLEEIQSQWATDLRKQAEGSKVIPREDLLQYQNLSREYHEIRGTVYENPEQLENLRHRENELANDIADFRVRYPNIDDIIEGRLINQEAPHVPEMPFEKNWHEVALKQALRMAIDEGYQRLTWSKGADVSNYVYLGIEHAENLYDKMIPQFLEKYARKWGGGPPTEGGLDWGPDIAYRSPAGNLQYFAPEQEAEMEAKGWKPEDVRRPKPVHSLDIPSKMADDIRTTGQSLFSFGGIPPVKEVVDFAKKITGGVRQIYDQAVEGFAPKSGVDPRTLDVMFMYKGRMEKEQTRVNDMLSAWDDAARSLTRDQAVEWLDRRKTGHDQVTPELQQLDAMTRQLDAQNYIQMNRARIAAGVAEDLTPFLEDHFRLFYKESFGTDPSPAQINAFLSKRSSMGTKGFLFGHIYDTASEALAAGKELRTNNVIDMFKLSHADVQRYISALNMWKWAKDTGRAEFVKRGEDPPAGYVQLDDRLAKVYFKVPEGMVHAGEYWVEEGFGRLLNNYLSIDRLRSGKYSPIGRSLLWLKNATTPWELFGPYHAMTIGNQAIAAELALSAREGKMPSLRPIADLQELGMQMRSMAKASWTEGSWNDYVRSAEGQAFLNKFPDAQNLLRLAFQGGLKLDIPEELRNQAAKHMMEAFADKRYGGALMRLGPAMLERSMSRLFNTEIPALKRGVFMRDMAQTLRENSDAIQAGQVTPQTLARQVVQRVENQFGEMNFDNMFWNRTLKSTLQVIYRSVTWRLGNILQVSSAIKGAAQAGMNLAQGNVPAAKLNAQRSLAHAATIMGDLATTVMWSAALQYAFTGKTLHSITDALNPQIGTDERGKPMRINVATYWSRDFHKMFSDVPGGAIDYLTSGQAAWVTRFKEAVQNKDFYNVKISESDSKFAQFFQRAAHIMPPMIAAQNVQRMKNEAGPKGAVLGLFGSSLASRKLDLDPGEIKALDLMDRSTKPMSREDFEQRQLMNGLTARIRSGDKTVTAAGGDLDQLVNSGKLSEGEADTIMERADTAYIDGLTRRMGLVDLLKVYKAARDPDIKSRVADRIQHVEDYTYAALRKKGERGEKRAAELAHQVEALGIP